MTKFTGKQQTFLDIFRIVAAFFVMVGHSFSWYQLTWFKDQQYFPYIQNIGVVMLFLLSGFLTTYSIERRNVKHDYTFKLFLKYKFIRIIKEYFPGLVIVALVDRVSIALNGSCYGYFDAYNIKQFFGNLFMLHGTVVNYIPGIGFIPFGSARPLWTLAIEWWFYLLFAYIYLTIANKRELTFGRIIMLGILIVTPIEYIIGGRGGGLGFAFCLGILGYYIFEYIDFRSSKFVFLLSCILYIIYGIAFKEAYTIISFIILGGILCSGLKMWGVQCQAKENRLLHSYLKAHLCYI